MRDAILNRVSTRSYNKQQLSGEEVKRINNILFKLPLLAKNRDPKFVFAHIMAPHPPFVFGENGNKIYYDGNSMNRKTLFINQLKYINKRMINVLEKILYTNNGRNKIIIIQGDHGTREIVPNNIYSFKQDWVQEAFGNLNAIYFSDKIKNKKATSRLLNPQTIRDKKDTNNKTQKVFQRISCNVFSR